MNNTTYLKIPTFETAAEERSIARNGWLLLSVSFPNSVLMRG
ncbi:hypothetical protein [Priestia filamentosa]|nr:hypothetical protein [Priestia filamentosa]WCM14599.1 hypothetical protein PGN40_14735 [Priestia filamentosa]